MASRLYTTNQLAALFGVVPTTVIDWVERGKLEAFKTLGGHRRITHQAVLQFLERNRLAYPPAFAAEAPGVALWTPEPAQAAALTDGLHVETPGARVRSFDTLAEFLLGCGQEAPRLAVLGAAGPEVLEATHALRKLLHAAAPSILVVSPDESADEALRTAGASATLRRGATVSDLLATCRRLLATR
jgi:excisionase family DNA binding protein